MQLSNKFTSIKSKIALMNLKYTVQYLSRSHFPQWVTSTCTDRDVLKCLKISVFFSVL